MESSEQPRAARRSAGEWLFQLTTITVGVLIALSFDALLQWNALSDGYSSFEGAAGR